MTSQITFFPVSNGDMTLIRLATGRHVLIDCNIRKPDDDIPDVAKDLRSLLKTDGSGRPYVDVMVLSHPDQDHCRGLLEHFHLAPLAEYCNKDEPKKIVIREMWSSPLVFRRSNKKNHTLCKDAKAWNAEAKRRVNLYKEEKNNVDGDRILILSEDNDGKTDGIPDILIKEGERITKICGEDQSNFSALLLAPLTSSDAEEEEVLSKNESSVIMNYSIGAGNNVDAVKFLSGGDAEVVIWEKQWARHKHDVTPLQYNLMLAPHHCSWHSLSCDSWSEMKRKVAVSKEARNALSQALPGAIIVASSKVIKDDDVDPPCIRAKEEYEAIVNDSTVKGEFWNTSSYLSETEQVPLTFEITEGGLKRTKNQSATRVKASGIAGAFGTQPLMHG